MERVVKTTADNSRTLYIEELDECYHSHHGALQEAEHVFIKNGLEKLDKKEINILEMGFGTGLNVLVTLEAFLAGGVSKINYFSLEKYPINADEVRLLGYDELFSSELTKKACRQIHECDWEEPQEIYPNFFLTKIKTDFFDLDKIILPEIDLVYFDCFGARVQPDLWEKPLFELVKTKMKKGGLLTTYSSKGSVRRALQELGFEVQKLEGPKGKREMLNAVLL